ncbi:MAG: Tyrocidine synthase 1 [Acidobacteria bacterium]|nr:Tyrocidine synthase 1 [Acidobacteriota bacterium]
MSFLLQDYVTRSADKTPEAIAIVASQEQVSYRQMEEASNQLARLLKRIGCEKGDRICFLMPKSPAAIISMIAALKADCAYVPLDSSSPASRLAKIVAACDPRCILITESVSSLLDDLLTEAKLPVTPIVGLMDRKAQAGTFEGRSFKPGFTYDDVESHTNGRLDYQASSEGLAHILFTSGSTGNPKGVMIKHSNVIHFIEWAVKYFGVNSEDRVSGHPPLHFDLSTFDIYGTFAAGAQLHLVPAELNLLPNKMAHFIRSSELTQWFSVPSALNYLAKLDVVRDNDFPSLRRLLWCGEVFPTPALRYWMERLPHVQFTNLYGPTEATIASSYYTVPCCPATDNDPIPIGNACAGEELLVLDDDLKPVAQGEVGNLYIRGVGLSPGYWRDQEKTDSAFIQDPFEASSDDRIYRTGDLARIGTDGLIYFLGRADSQIKSRGYRIELGEIETALNALGVTQDCAVIAINTDSFEGAIICCAYVPLPGSDVPSTLLRSLLSKSLPGYMLPTRWMSIERMPLNVNEKYDRRKLKEDFLAAELKRAAPPVKHYGASTPAWRH